MPQSFTVETKHHVVGLLVRVERGCRFYASDQAFAALEVRQYRRIEDARLDIGILPRMEARTFDAGRLRVPV